MRRRTGVCSCRRTCPPALACLASPAGPPRMRGGWALPLLDTRPWRVGRKPWLRSWHSTTSSCAACWPRCSRRSAGGWPLRRVMRCPSPGCASTELPPPGRSRSSCRLCTWRTWPPPASRGRPSSICWKLSAGGRLAGQARPLLRAARPTLRGKRQRGICTALAPHGPSCRSSLSRHRRLTRARSW